MKTLLDAHKCQVVIERLAHQLIENHGDFSNTVLIGIQPRGIFLSDRLVDYISKRLKKKPAYGKLDITFYRDDYQSASSIPLPRSTELDLTLEGKQVVLIDDVLFTGRTVRSALDALLDFGRPRKVELMTLIDRRYNRELPIQADYSGLVIDSSLTEKVKVYWKQRDGEDKVVIIQKADTI
ncbi:MAG TPA: bifunctional pyr operon transcriptional regulator/uracil phosphoribosyltransferase PyrR [Chitinophagaceae bacterium]|nr:bifunctional pyr operon transcriptional regulator/uracil phosphoribosyltransferase PyrR [Chitinophagaceae bacterium]